MYGRDSRKLMLLNIKDRFLFPKTNKKFHVMNRTRPMIVIRKNSYCESDRSRLGIIGCGRWSLERGDNDAGDGEWDMRKIRSRI